MEGLEQSKARMPLFVLQLACSLLVPFALILLEMRMAVHFLGANAIINEFSGSLFSIAGASLGIHIIRRRIHLDSFLEVLFTLNIVVATLSGIGITARILRFFAHISFHYSSSRWAALGGEDWVMAVVTVFPSAIQFGLSVYVAFAVTKINKVAEKRKNILLSCGMK